MGSAGTLAVPFSTARLRESHTAQTLFVFVMNMTHFTPWTSAPPRRSARPLLMLQLWLWVLLTSYYPGTDALCRGPVCDQMTTTTSTVTTTTAPITTTTRTRKPASFLNGSPTTDVRSSQVPLSSSVEPGLSLGTNYTLKVSFSPNLNSSRDVGSSVDLSSTPDVKPLRSGSSLDAETPVNLTSSLNAGSSEGRSSTLDAKQSAADSALDASLPVNPSSPRDVRISTDTRSPAPASPTGASNSSCVATVLAPKDFQSYGLVDNATFWKILDQAKGAAQKALNDTCIVKVHVHIVDCTPRSALRAAVKGDFGDSVLIGPPCWASACIISLLDNPVITWVPLLTSDLDLIEDDLDKGQDQRQRSDCNCGSAVSSFGSYNSLVRSVIYTLRHFGWSRIAIVYSTDEICNGFHEQLTVLAEAHQVTTVHHLGFDERNTSALENCLAKAKETARIIVTCTNPDVFRDLLTSAEKLRMTSGYYAIVHANLGTNVDYVLKGRASNVLFVGNFTSRASFRGPRAATSSKATSRTPQGQFLDYFYDAIQLWAAARKRTLPRQTLRFNNLTLEGRSGRIKLNARGMRRRHHFLFHYRGGKLVQVADLSRSYHPLQDVDWPGGHLPADHAELVSEDGGSNPGTIVGGVLGALLAALFVLMTALLIRRRRLDRLLNSRSWQVDDCDVKRRQTHMTSQNGVVPQRRLVRMETRGTLGLGSICSLDRNQLFAHVGNYRGIVVAVRTVQSKTFRLTKEMITDLNILKELNHENINTFVGAHIEPGNSYLLFKYCSKGSLQDVLENDDVTLDWMFKMSFATDLARGMVYLHKSAIRSHGNLKSSNCVIDSRWVLKVTDFGAVTSPDDYHYDEDNHHATCNGLLWTAPELLRLDERPRKGTQRGDVFSFAIVLQEILFRVGPYGCDSSSPEEIVEEVKRGRDPPFRPCLPLDHGVPEKALTLMTSCWEELPEQRPEFSIIRKRLIELNGGRKVSMLDNMLSLMETYSTRLEHLVADRTAELAQEKAKTDRLLYQMLPASVADQLKSGRAVIPEFYDAVSIFFSDIVGFTTIASQSKPLEVVDLLNDLYTAFDDVILRRDVYKVETIGDAYMVVSGCPRRNGRRHASEIAELALDLSATVTGVQIRHRPEESLQLRIGLHTGPCAAGVVGVAMPRYCLFGDTVNMTSRMESTGKALHIHISSEMQSALEELNCGFLTLERGWIQVKGKGIHKTYWLVGKDSYTKPLPQTFEKLRQTLDEASSRPISPSNTSLNVDDGMYSALRKTSLAASVMSDPDDAYPGSPVRSESGVDTTWPAGSHDVAAHNESEDVFNGSDAGANNDDQNGGGRNHGTIPRIEIS